MRRKATSPRAEHKNAIVKMVKEKRMILIADLARVMNNKNIKSAVETLVKEGKIKKQKIQVRGLVGNLTNQWLIYDNSIKQNEILDFERETVNRTFQSPLVENHCYKSIDEPVEQNLKDETDLYKQIDNPILDYFNEPRKTAQEEVMCLTVITNEVIPIYNNNNNRTVNARELHEFLGIGKDFTTWIKDRIAKYDFTEGKDYILTLTKTGERKNVTKHEYYLKINTAKEIAMVENNERGKYIRKYFIETEEAYAKQNSIQQINGVQSLDDIYNFMKMSAMGFTDLNNRVKSLEGTIESMKKAISE